MQPDFAGAAMRKRMYESWRETARNYGKVTMRLTIVAEADLHWLRFSICIR
jgi:hypothetical protein